MRYWTKKEDDILKEYGGKKSTEEIAKILGRSKASVQGRAAFKRIPLSFFEFKWTEEEKRILIETTGKISIFELMKLIPNKSRSAIKQKARKLDKSTRFLQPRKSEVDYSFFEYLTPQLLHFIGFWWADGNLYNNVLSFSVHIRDKEFLVKLVEQFTNSKVREYSGRSNESVFHLGHAKLSNLLKEKYEFRENKSLTLEIPSYINTNNIKYFVRGFFEGDGWIAKRDRTVGLCCANKKFIEDLGKILKSIGYSFRIRNSGILYRITFSAKDSINFLRWVYNTNEEITTMERKFKLYKEIELYTSFNYNYITLHKLANILGIHNQTLYNWREKYPIEPEIVTKNNYYLFSRKTLSFWLKNMGRTDYAKL